MGGENGCFRREMLTWVIVKTRLDSSLNAYEHCVACDDENNCPRGPALRGQPSALSPYPAFDLRCTPLFEVLKHFEKQCTATFCLHRWPAAVRTAPFCQHKCAQRQNKRFLAYFGGILLYPGKARFWPILAYFEAICGLHLAGRGPIGQLWAPKWGPPLSRPPILHIVGGCPVLKKRHIHIRYLRGVFFST